MDLMSWLRRLGGGRPEDHAVAGHHLTHRETSPQEDELRAELAADPNDRVAFDALVEIVRERADEGVQPDPLTAVHVATPAQQHSVWALAEELAGQPKAWLPLVVLAELSLSSDHEGAMRRLNLACERETSGVALTHALAMLRDAGALSDAVSFGVAHWQLASRHLDAGREVVMAALESGRVSEARRLVDSLTHSVPSALGAAEVEDLEQLVEAGEKLEQRG